MKIIRITIKIEKHVLKSFKYDEAEVSYTPKSTEGRVNDDAKRL